MIKNAVRLSVFIPMMYGWYWMAGLIGQTRFEGDPLFFRMYFAACFIFLMGLMAGVMFLLVYVAWLLAEGFANGIIKILKRD